jgi:electron transport complex protein RnfB
MTDIKASNTMSQTDNHPQNAEQTRLADLPILFKSLHINALSAEVQAEISRVDACLPQTQCGLCEHPDGCLPYAAAIVLDGEPYNKCVPGGQPVTDAIAQTIGIDTQDTTLTAMPSQWPIDITSGRPTEVRAVIREDDCIGCTKCIPACPVDAIVGTGKHMHTIFTDLCTGCELCIAPCPVDCIDLVAVEREISMPERIAEQVDLRHRYHTHLRRVTEQLADTSNSRPVVSMVEAKLNNAASQSLNISEAQAKNTIAAAKLRTKIKKLEKQLSVRANDKKQMELESLQAELESLQAVL